MNLFKEKQLSKLVKYSEDGKIKSKTYYKGKELHRDDDKPAIIEYWYNGDIYSKKWYKDGKIHRGEDKPAIITYSPAGGVISSQEWYKNGKKHRNDDKASLILYDKSGRIVYQQWYDEKGRFHRKEGPASIFWFFDSDFKPDTNSDITSDFKPDINYAKHIISGENICRIEKWYKNGKIHNENGPAIIYYKNGNKYREEYWNDNVFLRFSPMCYPNGQIREEWIPCT